MIYSRSNRYKKKKNCALQWKISLMWGQVKLKPWKCEKMTLLWAAVGAANNKHWLETRNVYDGSGTILKNDTVAQKPICLH